MGKELDNKKQMMLAYEDFFGGDIHDKNAIKKAKTEKELSDIINQHESFLEDMLSDAKSHLKNFRENLGFSEY